jgi:hypothetical protein
MRMAMAAVRMSVHMGLAMMVLALRMIVRAVRMIVRTVRMIARTVRMIARTVGAVPMLMILRAPLGAIVSTCHPLSDP